MSYSTKEYLMWVMTKTPGSTDGPSRHLLVKVGATVSTSTRSVSCFLSISSQLITSHVAGLGKAYWLA